MKGIIFLWFGAIVDVPTGWALCDGTQGTPNLKDQFVYGAGLTYTPGQFAPHSFHRHPFTSDDHAHTIPYDNEIAAGADYSKNTYVHAAIGTTNYTKGFPPYHALCYIMKLP